MRKALLTALLLPCLMLALLSTRWLMASMYHRLGQRPHASIHAALNADLRSVELAPWRAPFHTALARSFMRSGESPDAVRAQFVDALQWSPSDAYLWLDWSQILAYRAEFGGELELAVNRINQLAPSAPAVQASNAMIGVRYWYRGSLPMQKQWLSSMQYEMRHQPRKFLKLIVDTDQMYWFCASAALELPLQKWCGYLWASPDPMASVSRQAVPKR